VLGKMINELPDGSSATGNLSLDYADSVGCGPKGLRQLPVLGYARRQFCC
jgi:hypothetical protein